MESKTQGSPWALQEPLACPITQIQTLTRMDKGAVKDYYHMTLMDENVKYMKPTHPLLEKIVNLKIWNSKCCLSPNSWDHVVVS